MPCRPAIASHSLGRAWVHSDLIQKLHLASIYGFDIELFYEDLYHMAQDLPGGPSPENQYEAARIIRRACDEREIAIVLLGPFMHYEGLRDREKHRQRIEEMRLWIKLAKILGTTLIAIPSTFLSEDETSGDMNLILADMREIAELGAAEGVGFAYEALSWGTYIDTWEQSWEVVTKVDRPNFGLCLDTFNMAARVYADPTSPTGKKTDAERDMAASLQRLVQTVDVTKLAFVQVVDAERLVEPLLPGHPLHAADQPPRMSWSRNCRLFYGEDGYLPIQSILKAIVVDLGYDGHLSAELFSRSLTEPDPQTPANHARRAAISWQKIVDDIGFIDKDEDVDRAAHDVLQVPRAQL